MKNKLALKILIFLSLAYGLFAKPVGIFSMVIGKVQVKDGSQWIQAQPGMKVNEKAEIQTGIKSRATLQLVNGSQLQINPGTVVSIDRLLSGNYGTATDVNLSLGKITAVIARADKEDQRNFFRVRTPTAVAGVRGSVQEVAYSPDTGTSVRMLEHAADVIGRNGQKVYVPESGETKLSADKIITPEQGAQAQSIVVFSHAGISSQEQDFLLFTNDLSFSSAASDYTEFFRFWDSLFDKLYNQSFVIIEFEKL